MKTRSSPKKTLVLDLDETLAHSSLRPDFPYERVLQLTIRGQTGSVFSGRRPFLHKFLQEAAQLFELVAFSASEEEYASALLDWIDPERLIKHRLFKSACTLAEGLPIKDLRVLGRNLSDVVIVDNSLYAFGLQLDNGIPIGSWYGDQADEELVRLLPALRILAEVPDAPAWLRKQLSLARLVLNN